MAPRDRESLRELVDAAMVAAETASYLRCKRQGADPGLPAEETLDSALEFLAAAEGGGKFLATGQLSPQTTSLRPLNWAMDWYTQVVNRKQDYAEVTTYLGEINDCLKQLRRNSNCVEPERMDTATKFFEGLSDRLTASIEHYRTVDSFAIGD